MPPREGPNRHGFFPLVHKGNKKVLRMELPKIKYKPDWGNAKIWGKIWEY